MDIALFSQHLHPREEDSFGPGFLFVNICQCLPINNGLMFGVVQPSASLSLPAFSLS